MAKIKLINGDARDYQLAADLMKKATQQNVQKVSKTLLQYALERGYGPAFGLTNIEEQE